MTQTTLTGAQKLAVMRMPVEYKTKPLITAKRQFIRNQEAFNYTFFSTVYSIIGHFATFEGWPLHPSNTECFVGEPQISVLYSSNCCKMISLNNDINIKCNYFRLRQNSLKLPCEELFLQGIFPNHYIALKMHYGLQELLTNNFVNYKKICSSSILHDLHIKFELIYMKFSVSKIFCSLAILALRTYLWYQQIFIFHKSTKHLGMGGRGWGGGGGHGHWHVFQNHDFTLPHHAMLWILEACDFVLRMSCLMRKPTKWLCTKRRLRSVWASTPSDRSLLCTQWVAKDPSCLHADSEDSDKTGQMPRLIWVFTGRTVILLVLLWGSSNMFQDFL